MERMALKLMVPLKPEQPMSMKHYLLVATVAASYSLPAPNSQVVSACGYMGDEDYDKAAEYIEPTITSESTSAKEKTWRYRGTIYAHIPWVRTRR